MSKQFLFALLAPAFLIGCSDDGVSPQQDEAEVEVRQIVLGEKLPKQVEVASERSKYTGLIEDLVDDYKTGEAYDRVSGFTMKQIEKAFKKNTTWDSLKSYFKKLKVANDEDIDKVFARWS